MAVSQNGYTANDIGLTDSYRVPGTTLALRLRKEIAPALVYVAQQFHERVESIDAGSIRDDWSWAVRPVRGSTTILSNHASGTAIDLNALKHPRGVRGTFTSAQVTQIRRILAEIRDPATDRSVVRWGGDFGTVVDEMHFEIASDVAGVRRAMANVKGSAVALTEAEIKQIAVATATEVWTRFLIRDKNGVPIPVQQALSYMLQHDQLVPPVEQP